MSDASAQLSAQEAHTSCTRVHPTFSRSTRGVSTFRPDRHEDNAVTFIALAKPNSPSPIELSSSRCLPSEESRSRSGGSRRCENLCRRHAEVRTATRCEIGRLSHRHDQPLESYADETVIARPPASLTTATWNWVHNYGFPVNGERPFNCPHSPPRYDRE